MYLASSHFLLQHLAKMADNANIDLILDKNFNVGGIVVSTVASQPEGLGLSLEVCMFLLAGIGSNVPP